MRYLFVLMSLIFAFSAGAQAREDLSQAKLKVASEWIEFFKKYTSSCIDDNGNWLTTKDCVNPLKLHMSDEAEAMCINLNAISGVRFDQKMKVDCLHAAEEMLRKPQFAAILSEEHNNWITCVDDGAALNDSDKDKSCVEINLEHMYLSAL